MNLLNLRNETLKIGINANPPFTFLRFDDSLNQWLVAGGSEVKIIETLKEHFNFSTEYINCNRVWGYKLLNNSWNGLIGNLIRKEVDMGIGGVSLNYDRLQVINFLSPHYHSSFAYITPRPRPTRAFNQLAFKPFDSTIWIMFIASLMVCFLFNLIWNRFHQHSNLFWLSVVMLFRQHWNKTSRQQSSSRSFNVWIAFWNFGMFILTTAYAGRLYSLLTVPHSLPTIDTVSELFEAVQSRKFKVVLIHNTFHTETIKNYDVPLFAEFRKSMVNVDNELEAFNLVKNSSPDRSYVFMTLRDTLRYGRLIFGEQYLYLPTENMDSSMFSNFIAIAVRPEFPYYKQFDNAAQWLTKYGLVDHWKEEQYRRLTKSKFVATKTNELITAFDLKHLKSFLVIYLNCILFSTIVFTFETIWKYFDGNCRLFDTNRTSNRI
ncbi:Pantetheinase [Sarcoptes scabiei]|nr:Pantetheinase [Sarcoptes scabiei]